MISEVKNEKNNFKMYYNANFALMLFLQIFF